MKSEKMNHNNDWDLQRLRDKREEILKAELFMLLHDVGKLHAGHQSKYIVGERSSGYFHAHLRTRVFNACPDISRRMPPFMAAQTIQYPKQRSNNENFQASLAQVIGCHHRPRYSQELQNEWNRLSPLIRLAAYVDWRDSEYDRENIDNSSVCRPTSSGFGVFTIFGNERFLYSFDDRVRQERNMEFAYNDPSFPDVFHLRNALHIASLYIDNIDNSSPHSNRRDLSLYLRLLFERAAGDTRHSVNDISLWEHSWSTAQIYKSLLANGFLNERGLTTLANNFHQRQLRPQLLPLRIDGLAYLAQSNNVPDLLARRVLLQRVYDTWQDILEWEFPLAGEVYRDENGPVFLTFLRDKTGKNAIPLKQLDLPQNGNTGQVLADAYNEAKNLEEYLRRTIVHLTQGDLTLRPSLELHTYTQKRSKDGKSLGDVLREEREKGLQFQPDIATISQAWNAEPQQERCSICGLRPLGYGVQGQNRDKAISRRMCGVCLERREMRAKPWVHGVHMSSHERFQQGHPETVWLDEVADKNGRIALIVGYFPLEHWLDGTLVESLVMFKRTNADPSPTNRKIVVHNENLTPIEVVIGPKPVSYSRIRRVWETTRRFWQDVAPTDAPPIALQNMLQGNEYDLALQDLWEGPLSLKDSLAGQAIKEERPRLFLKGKLQNGSLGPYHAYELEIQGRKVAVLWVPENATDEEGKALPYHGGFWVIENLDYLKGEQIFGRDLRGILAAGTSYAVYEPTEYGRPGQPVATFRLDEMLPKEPQENISYTPLIPILAEPRTFMALVPAAKALDVVKAIKTKYEREMGKVRNRLPLHLGVVFAGRKMPLRAIMDAGRRMLDQKANPVKWTVECVARKQNSKGDPLPKRFNKDKDGQFKEWYEVLLKSDGKQFTWYVPALMGDGVTEDHWYPYVFLVDCGEPSGRSDKRYYCAPNPWTTSRSWAIHVAALQPGDTIYFTPSTFDFIFLDSNSRRYQVFYDEDGRCPARPRFPFLLDEVDRIEEAWRLIKEYFTQSQIHQLIQEIEQKREAWFKGPEIERWEKSQKDPTFRRFVQDAFANAQVKKSEGWNEQKREFLAGLAIDGTLAQIYELYHSVLKQKIEDNDATTHNQQ